MELLQLPFMHAIKVVGCNLKYLLNGLRIFFKSTGATKEDPVLLILDSNSTHTMNMEVINFARANGVVLLVYHLIDLIICSR